MNPRRGRSSSLAASPTLVGAVTIVVTLVAVFLSYNANEGLPFVPTYPLKVEVENSAGLVRGNEVRIGGARAGVVTSIDATTRANGKVVATLELALEPRLEPLPRDSTITVRPRSPLGLKYVEITEGHSTRGFPRNATVPLANATPHPVEIDDVFNMFDDPTRVGIRGSVEEFGTAVTGRGESLNRAIAKLDPLLRKLEPAMRMLASERTDLDALFPSLEQAAGEVAPVAGVQSSLFVALDNTFAAFASVTEPLQESISGGPPTLDVAIRELPAQRRFLAESTELFRRLRPGLASLAAASPGLADAFRAGEPALRRVPSLNRRVTSAIESLDSFADDERVPRGLARLARTASLLQPPVAFATPAQTVCNYGALFFRNFASALSEADVLGTQLRASIISLPQLPGSEAGPAAAPANGPFSATSTKKDSFLHSNPYPNTAAPGQEHECEAGEEKYIPRRQVIGNEPGNQGVFPELTKRKLK
jgi:ABC-type transporter Mla subunit MlaD